jgi:uncharacterized membrane protein YtjA (UPF0391 family)
MLRWALIFFVISIIAGVLGFTNISGSALAIAQVLFYIFIACAALLLIAGLFLINRN